MSFFADNWFLCKRTDPSERPCTGTGSSTRRNLVIADFPAADMPGFLVVSLDGNRVGYGFAKEDATDARKNEIYFFEVLAAGGAVHYVGKVFSHSTPEGIVTTQVQGKLKRLRLDGSTFPLAAGDDDWTANRPTA